MPIPRSCPRLPAALRRPIPPRPKVFGVGSGRPLDRNARARLMAYADAYNARHRQPRQHWGPFTAAYMRVLRALLWTFHNSRDGRCFPGYGTIAKAARCCRDTVIEAIKTLEAAGILTVETRRKWERVRIGGQLVRVTRRTSNAYAFRDPQPQNPAHTPTSENPTRTQTQDFLSLGHPNFDPESDLVRALASLGSRMKEERC